MRPFFLMIIRAFADAIATFLIGGAMVQTLENIIPLPK